MINGNACFAYFNKIWGIPTKSTTTAEKMVQRGVLESWGAIGRLVSVWMLCD